MRTYITNIVKDSIDRVDEGIKHHGGGMIKYPDYNDLSDEENSDEKASDDNSDGDSGKKKIKVKVTESEKGSDDELNPDGSKRKPLNIDSEEEEEEERKDVMLDVDRSKMKLGESDAGDITDRALGDGPSHAEGLSPSSKREIDPVNLQPEDKRYIHYILIFDFNKTEYLSKQISGKFTENNLDMATLKKTILDLKFTKEEVIKTSNGLHDEWITISLKEGWLVSALFKRTLKMCDRILLLQVSTVSDIEN